MKEMVFLYLLSIVIWLFKHQFKIKEILFNFSLIGKEILKKNSN